jgi:hypothetical protein
MNKKILIVSSIIFLGLFFGIYQCFQVFETENVSAVSIGTPIAGHPWSQMECSGDTLCVDTTNKRVGIGINNPTVKLDVDGTIRGTDVCNTTGNCLSALATLTNACGAAATTYAYTATAYSGTYCVMGTSTPASPVWPAAGETVTWTCPVANGSPISCTATHSPAPVAGVCGAAQQTYVYSATAYSGALCSTGTASPASPAFPSCGSSSSWSCLGTNGGASPSCTASRNACPTALYNETHNANDCEGLGGTSTIVAAGVTICQIPASSCPSGWSQYQSYSATNGGTLSCCSPADDTCSYWCTPGNVFGHAWQDKGIESASVCTCVSTSSSCIRSCTIYATVFAIGCY